MNYDKDYADWKVGDKVINNMQFVEHMIKIPGKTLFTIDSISCSFGDNPRHDSIIVINNKGNKLTARGKWKFQRVATAPEPNP